MKFSDDDICRGCVFEDCKDKKSQCKIKEEERDIDCPCTECLLKVICQNSCSLYKKLLIQIMK